MRKNSTPVLQDTHRLGKPFESDTIGLREAVFVGECGHGVFTASIGDGHGLGPKTFGRGRDVDGRVACSNHKHILANVAFLE